LSVSALKQVLTESVVISTLEKSRAELRTDLSQLAAFISNRAPNLFAILAWSEAAFVIGQFYEQGFDDDKFPVELQIRQDENESAVEAFPCLNRIENHPFNNEEFWTARKGGSSAKSNGSLSVLSSTLIDFATHSTNDVACRS
jgi:hypothetical protein